MGGAEEVGKIQRQVRGLYSRLLSVECGGCFGAEWEEEEVMQERLHSVGVRLSSRL